jgi:hypothetical protein
MRKNKYNTNKKISLTLKRDLKERKNCSFYNVNDGGYIIETLSNNDKGKFGKIIYNNGRDLGVDQRFLEKDYYQTTLNQGWFTIFDYQKYLSVHKKEFCSRNSYIYNASYNEEFLHLKEGFKLVNEYYKEDIEFYVFNNYSYIFMLKSLNVIEIDYEAISIYGDNKFVLDNSENVKEIKDKMLLAIPPKEQPKANNIYFLMEKNKNLTLQPFELKPLVIDIDNHYNDDFNNISNLIISSINNDINGLILLHGQPGCGKTSYSQYLTTQIKRKIVFIPPSMFQTLQSPSFLDFLYENRGCCLIIEDAENLIRDRKFSNGLDCSFLLNLTDGFVSKILNMQVICTFNCDLKEVDEALLRKGRLICSYEFKKLSLDKTNKMLIGLYGNDFNNNVELTLAEIYGFEAELYNDVKKERNKIGF